MIQIAEHTIKEDIINKSGWALDLGCIGFNFSSGIKNYVDNVIGVDPNPSIQPIPGIHFENLAVIPIDSDQSIYYNTYTDSQANSLLMPMNDICVFSGRTLVKTTTISKLMEKYGVKQFEVIKIDIEGGEYDLLNSLDFTISKQFSIEFHDFRNMNPYHPNNEEYYSMLFTKLKEYCDVVQHTKTHHPGFSIGMGFNYWDSLFVLKEKYWK